MKDLFDLGRRHEETDQEGLKKSSSVKSSYVTVPAVLPAKQCKQFSAIFMLFICTSEINYNLEEGIKIAERLF